MSTQQTLEEMQKTTEDFRNMSLFIQKVLDAPNYIPIKNVKDNTIVYDINGAMISKKLLTEKDATIQIFTHKEKCLIPHHKHEAEEEIFVLLKGESTIVIEGENSTINILNENNRTCTVPKGAVHYGYTDKGTELLSIIIPRSKLVENLYDRNERLDRT